MECSVLSLLPQVPCSDPSQNDVVVQLPNGGHFSQLVESYVVVAGGSEDDPLLCGDVVELSLPPHS